MRRSAVIAVVLGSLMCLALSCFQSLLFEMSCLFVLLGAVMSRRGVGVR